MHVPHHAFAKFYPQTLMIMKTKLNTILTRCLKFLSLLCFFALLSCEKELDFKGVTQETDKDIIINALAVEGKPLKVMVSHAYQVGKTPNLNTKDYDHSVFFTDDASTDYQTMEYYLQTAIQNAEVQAVVNGSQTYRLVLEEENLEYVCDYVPKVNDHIEVKVQYKDKERDNTQTSVCEAYAETTVPPRPMIEVVDYEVLDDNPYRIMNNLTYDSDTIMRITCRITDTADNQYYRLRVRGMITDEPDVLVNEGEIWENDDHRKHYIMQDIFFSEDELFLDSRLNTNFGGWPAFFSNVFDDELLKRGDYTFVGDSPKPVVQETQYEMHELHPNGEWVPMQVIVELQAISPELYRYLKSVELFRVSSIDAFSEPIQIYSNVKDGWGIVGSLTSHRFFIPY